MKYEQKTLWFYSVLLVSLAGTPVVSGNWGDEDRPSQDRPRPDPVLRDEQTRLLKEIIGRGNTAQQVGDDRVRLDMFGPGVTDQTLAWAGSLKNLSSLTVSGDGLTDDTIRNLKGLGPLDELILSHNRITDRGILSSIDLDQIAKLYVLMEDGVDGSFLADPKSRGLESLSFLGVSLKEDSLRTLGEYRRLKRIGLSGRSLGDKALAYMARCQSLEALTITDAMFSDAGVASLARHPKLHTFEAWSRSGRVTDESLRSLGSVEKLATLSLSNANLTDQGLAYLKSNSMLRSLELDSGGIGDEGLRHLGHLTKLKSLSVRSRRITGTNLEIICQNCKDIEYLDLSKSRLSDSGLAEIAKLESLKTLVLIGVPLADSSIRRFKKDNPNVKVVF